MTKTTAEAPTHRLPPAGVLLWRSPASVQLEIGTQRMVVDGLDTAVVRDLLSDQARPGRSAGPSITQLRQRLEAQGYLWPEDEEFTPPVPRLAAELTALSARVGQDAADALHARGSRTVVIQGAGRAGTLTACVLAAAGVGRVHVATAASTRLVHAIPGGAAPADEGTPLAEVSARAIRAAAPEVDVSALALGHSPDLVVLAIDEPVDTDLRDSLHAREVAHLAVSCTPGSGVVGPLVVPGRTSCLGCADLHRRDRDPAWPALAAQLSVPRRYTRSGEVAVCTAVAGIAAGQALAFLDGELPTVAEASLELQPPDWRVRRRSWPAHPECRCMPVKQDPDS